VSPTRVDDRVRRQARARATAASIIDQPRVARRFAVTAQTPLRAADRRRVHRHAMPRFALPGASMSRRRFALGVLAVQLVALFAILALPLFRASDVEISGNHLLDRSTILAAAHISPSQSLFTVDGEQVRQRLEKLPWVRSAAVETELPHTVRITIREWTPVLVLHRGAHEMAIADDGSLLDLGRVGIPAPPGVPLLVDSRPQLAAAHVGGSVASSIDPVLVRTLVITAQRFPAVFGVAVDHFEWQADGLFAIVTTVGWRAVLGHMLTDDDIAAVPDQLAALVSLKGRIDFVHPTFGYVDLEDPGQPAVGGKPGLATAAPSAAANAAPAHATPSPIPAATPKPSPTPAPTPTPIHFVIGPPPGH
jgi:cell division septal protein FtsQ